MRTLHAISTICTSQLLGTYLCMYVRFVLIMNQLFHRNYSSRFEKDYTRTKSKEVEDSEEIRRLKTEKSILIHRINGLEDVSYEPLLF